LIISENQKEVLIFLYAYTITIRDERIQQALFSVLSHSKCLLRTSDVVVFMERAVGALADSPKNRTLPLIVDVLVQGFTSACAQYFNSKKIGKLSKFMDIISFVSTCDMYTSILAERVVRVISEDFFGQLKSDRQLVVFQRLIDIRVSARSVSLFYYDSHHVY
jgi:hypothetical protein